MSGERVLVVDDYEDSRELYAEYLTLAGYTVTTAADGEAALDYALRQGSDLIVLDVAMPQIDGLSVLRTLRSNPATSGIPVIILSAMVGPEASDGAIRAGADWFLAKPCMPDELERVLRELLASRRAPAP